MTDSAAAERAHSFGEAISGIPTDSSSRNGSGARFGLVLAVLGVVLTVIGLIQSQTTSNPLDQSTALSLGLLGLAGVVLGSALFLRYSFGQFLRFWLLRLSYEIGARQPGNDR